jgi:hypothetical protein
MSAEGSQQVIPMTAEEIGQETSRSGYYYPNKMGRIILLALEEVMGRNGVNAVLNLAKLRQRVNNYPPNNLEKGFSWKTCTAHGEGGDSPCAAAGPASNTA